MNKHVLISLAGILLASVAAAACIAIAMSTPGHDGRAAAESEFRYGRVKDIEGSDSFLIEYGDFKPSGDIPAVFLAGGTQEIVTLPRTVPITASADGVESEAAYRQIGVGSLLKLQYDDGTLLSVTIVNDEAAAFAKRVKEAFLSGDEDGLASLISYPCYASFSPEGGGRIIKNREELSELKDKLFTEAFRNALRPLDTGALSPVQANVVMGREGGAPSVTFHMDSDGRPGITGISAVE